MTDQTVGAAHACPQVFLLLNYQLNEEIKYYTNLNTCIHEETITYDYGHYVDGSHISGPDP